MILRKRLYQHIGHVRGALKVVRINLFTSIKNIWSLDRVLPVKDFTKRNCSERFRGTPQLLVNDSNELLCTGCQKCKEICPARCIHIEKADGKMVSYNLEILRCSFCGLCAEVCPEKAIELTNKMPMPGFAEQEWLFDHYKLMTKEPN